MSSLVKNQIVKQLARFTKNLSPNKISVKFLKGEGELHNLELDETTLSELLELPPWIRLTKAVCNRISAKIHWTRLKTDPICLYLDCVEISMEATDTDGNTLPPGSPQTRPTCPPHQQPKEKAPNRYGFVEKVVDGMYVQINSAVISFKFQAFLATFQMSRLLIRSTTPKWETDDLRLTRVKDETRGEVLTFKEITWSTLRIDANALYNEKLTSQQSTPLRLITSHSALHITIKKRLEDCAVLSARLELLLDDILWVLTQSQLQALTGLLHSVNQAMSRTADMKGTKASVGSPAGQATQQRSNYTTSNVHDKKSDFESLNSLFTQHNVWETSYHLRTGSIDLHLCDDSEQTDGTSGKDGGAMHFQINKLSVDYYPYHLAGTSRTDWPSHNEASLTRAYWVGQLLNAFRNSLRSKQPDQRRPSYTHQRTKSDTSCVGADGRNSSQSPSFPVNPSLSPRIHPGNTSTSNPGESLQHSQSAHSIKNNMLRPVFMLERCFVVRCEEFFVKPVSTHDITQDDTSFLSSDKKALYLPSDMSAFQVDFTQYYYPGSVGSPVPHPNLFVQLNPIQLTLDIETCLWLNRFFRSVLGQRTWTMGPSAQSDSPPSHIDIRIEALMPKISFPCPSDPSLHYKDLRPQAVQIQASQVFVTNSRTGYKSSQTDLLMFLQPFMGSRVYTDFARFPSSSGDVRPLPNTAWVNDCSVLPNNFKMEKMMNGMHSDAFDTRQPSQVWCILAEQVWLDFLGIDELKNRPMPFIDAVPVHIWIATPLPGCRSTNISASPTSQSTRGSSQPYTVRHERSASEVIHPKTALQRKVFQPLSPPPKNRSGTAAAFFSTSSSDPNLRRTTSQEDPTGMSLDGPPAVYEPHINGSHNLEPTLSEPPPPYDTLSHNGPHLSGVPCEVTSAQNDFSGLSGAETQSCVDVEPGPKANVSFLINIPEHVNVLLDHFQFVFLMRLKEMLVKLQEELEKDENVHEANDSLQRNSSESVPAAFFSVVTQGVNVSIALPPAPDNDASRLDSHASQSTSRNVSSLSSYVDTGAVSDGDCISPEIAESKGNCKTEMEDGVGADKIPLSVNSNPKTNQVVPTSDEHGLPCSSQSASHTSSRASAVSATDSDGWLVVAAGDSKTGATSVPSRPGSTASNISSQLESSSTKESTNKDAKKSTSEARMVSIFSIEGDAVDIGIHLHGRDQVIKIVCPEVRIEELGVVNFEKYLNRKSFKKSLTKSTLTPSSEVTPMVRVRLEFGPGAERNEPTAGECGFARVKVHGLGGTLLMSSLESLSECFEDEVVLPCMPFIIEVENSAVSISNDNPPRLLSAPLAIPIDLTIDNVSIRRTHDGVFHITPTTPNPRMQDEEREPVTMAMTRQESINASQLSLSDSASVSSRAESLENEKQCLVAQMSVSRAALHSLQEERDALLKTIERLQQELSFSNREQDRLQEKMVIYQKGGRKTHR